MSRERQQTIAGLSRWWQRLAFSVSLLVASYGVAVFLANQTLELADQVTPQAESEVISMLRGVIDKAGGKPVVIHVVQVEGGEVGFEWYQANTVKTLREVAEEELLADVLIPKSVLSGEPGLVLTAVLP